jgi:molybdenum cofactor guanylyltransferase
MIGLVLAGGESRRLGGDKARLDGATLPRLAAERLAAACAEVAMADRGRNLVPGRPSLPDGAGRGPAAGILGGAAAYPGRPLLVLACDLPRVPAGLLAELARSGGCDWAVPRWAGGLEPLCALYGPRALAALAARVAAGRFDLHGLAEEGGLAVRYLEGEELRRFGDPGEVFFNLNTPDDLERWRREP